MYVACFLGFLAVFEGAGLFRKVREGAGIHFHQVSSKSDPGRPSYDQKNKWHACALPLAQNYVERLD